MNSFWQHTSPLNCPKGHPMLWLGSAYWVCEKCHVIYVQAISPRNNPNAARPSSEAA
jgi:hypothetical protein